MAETAAEQRRGARRFPVALGLGGGGAVLVALAAGLKPAGPDADGYGRRPAGVLAVVLLALLVVALFARHQEAWNPVAEQSRRSRPTWFATVLAGLATLGVGAYAAVNLWHGYRAGYPPLRPLLGLLGAAALLAALLLGWAAPVDGRWRWHTGRVLLAGATVLVLAATVALVSSTRDAWAVRTHAAAATTVPTVPTGVSEVAWRATVPASHIRDVVRAGAGVAIQIDDGALGIDGRTGAVRWSYRRVGADSRRLAASPDGATVVLAMDTPADGSKLVVLDAMTGRVRAQPDLHGGHTVVGDLTDTAIVVTTGDGLAGYSVRDGRQLWHWTLPDLGCRTNLRSDDVRLMPAEVIVAARCPGTALLVRLDAATGRERDRRPVSVSGSGSVSLRVAPDYSLLVVSYLDTAKTAQRLVAGPGTELVPLDTNIFTLLPAGRGLTPILRDAPGQVVDVRTGAPVGTQVDGLDNCVARATGLLADAALCQDARTAADFDTFFATGRVGVRIARYAGELGRLTVDLGPRQSHASGTGTVVSFAVGNGAVVAYSELPPGSGTANVIVGLR